MSHSFARPFSGLILFLVLGAASASSARAQDLEVHVINVDQGLSVFVRTPTGQRVLIDGGNPGDGTALVRPYLQSIGVTALDTSWMTHWHTDHFGGLTDLFNGGYKPLTAAYDRGDTNKPSNSFVTAYSSAVSGKRQIATLGQTLALGGGATLQVMAQNGAWIGGSIDPTQSSQEENSRSMALVIRYGDFDCYVGGDCTANGDGSTSNVEGPATAVIGQVEVAVASHHGSSTGSTTQVVLNLAPAMVVQSAGFDNPYGHPTKTVTNRWNTTAATRVQWCTTDGATSNGAGGFTAVNGSIVITSDGNTFRVARSNGPETVDFTTWEQPVAAATVADLVIGEALVDPTAATDAFGEWVELQSTALAPVSLAGLRVSSGANAFTIASPIVLDPGERFLFGVDGRGSRNGSVFVDLGAPWEQFGLLNGTSSLSIRTAANALIETLAWGGAGVAIQPGASTERIRPDLAATVANFASALTAWSTGDLGTPRTVNGNDPAACPTPVVFGNGKLASSGAAPTVGWTGTPSVYTDDFFLSVANAVPNKPAIGLYSHNQGAAPFYGGTLYVAAPVRRLPGQVLTPQGTGSWHFPLVAGDAGLTYFFQVWFRDPAHPDGTGVGLSNAMEVLVCPSSVSNPPPPPPGAGAIIVTEIMKDPASVTDANGEWLEVYNTTQQPIDIEGWTLRDDGSDVHVLDNGGLGLVVPAGQYRVLAINGNPATNGGITVFYTYANFVLANAGDEVVLSDASGAEVDRVNYLGGAPWPSTSGRALNLAAGVLDGTLNDDPANWCTASAQISPTNTDRGTPNAANTTCP